MLIKLKQIEHGTTDEVKALIPQKPSKIFLVPPRAMVYPDYDDPNGIWGEWFNNNHANDPIFPWDSLDCMYIFGPLNSLMKSVPNNKTSLPKLINTKNVVSFANAFSGFQEAVSFGGFESLESCSDLSFAFQLCSSIKEFPAFPKFKDGINCSHMFESCKAITKAPEIIGKIGNANSMFCGCVALKEVPEYDLSECKDTSHMFENCGTLQGEFPWAIDMSGIDSHEKAQNMFAGTHITKVTVKNARKAFAPGTFNEQNTFAALLGLNSNAETKPELVIKNYLDY